MEHGLPIGYNDEWEDDDSEDDDSQEDDDQWEELESADPFIEGPPPYHLLEPAPPKYDHLRARELRIRAAELRYGSGDLDTVPEIVSTHSWCSDPGG